LSSIAILLLYVVPFVVCALMPRSLWYIVAAGAILAGTEWGLAYHDNLIENGGDWHGGWNLLAFTGVFAVLLFGLWVALALLGLVLGRAARHRRPAR